MTGEIIFAAGVYLALILLAYKAGKWHDPK